MDGSGAAEAAELQWYAVRVMSTYERMTRDTLRRIGIVAEVPMEKRLRKRTAKQKVRQFQRYPAAPGYVLLACPDDVAFPWRKVFKWHTVRSVVSSGGAPARLEERSVFNFLNFEEEDIPDYFKFFSTRGPTFQIGDTVIIGSGMLQDRAMIVEDVVRGEAIFGVELFGQKQFVRVPVDQCFKSEAA
jgi:transcription antitermination factor NusG